MVVVLESAFDFDCPEEKTFGVVKEMRRLSTENSEEIRHAVEDGRKRIEALILEGKTLGVDG